MVVLVNTCVFHECSFGPYCVDYILQTPSRLSCVFHQGEASVWPLCHKAQISGVLQ